MNFFNSRVIASFLTFRNILSFISRGVSDVGPKICRNEFLFSYTNKMECVSTFRHINVKPGSIVFCDIDDTIFDYGHEIDEYWKRKIEDPGYNIWFGIMKSITPRLTDPYFHDFVRELEENGSEIYLITARNKNFKHVTHEHLHHHGLSKLETHHLTGSSKSRYIEDNFDLDKYNDKVFIDDSISNKEDVDNNLTGFKTILFKKNGSQDNNEQNLKRISNGEH